MAKQKYINTTEAAELTGRPYNEILNLAKAGVLPCHRTRDGKGHDVRGLVPDINAQESGACSLDSNKKLSMAFRQ